MMTYYKKCRIYGVVSVAFSVLFAFSEFAVAEPLSVFNGKTVVGVQQTKRTISGIVKDVDQRRQVRSQPVLPSLPRTFREEGYHIQPKHGGGIGRDRQDRVRRILRSRKRMPVSFPLV